MNGRQTYMVFWFMGSELGSLINNKANRREAEENWEMKFLRKDETGNEHYEIRQKGAQYARG